MQKYWNILDNINLSKFAFCVLRAVFCKDQNFCDNIDLLHFALFRERPRARRTNKEKHQLEKQYRNNDKLWLTRLPTYLRFSLQRGTKSRKPYNRDLSYALM